MTEKQQSEILAVLKELKSLTCKAISELEQGESTDINLSIFSLNAIEKIDQARKIRKGK